MATFTSWADELTRWKDALVSRKVDAFFLAATENRNEMRSVYRKLSDIQAFTEWLEQKAAQEAIDVSNGGGGILLSVGGA